MRIAFICDTHWGAKSDHPAFLFNHKRFLEEVFFPTLDQEGITTVVHLGDLTDRRKYINFYTLQRLREDFIKPVLDRKLDFHLILGNHDIYYKNNMNVVSVHELGFAEHLNVYNETEEVTLGGTKFLFVPWICDENKKESHKKINSSDAKILLGHLDINGFEMYKGLVQFGGENRSLFAKFDAVYSGHFHHQSSDGNIHYLGASSEYTWADYDDPRGFHIFDCDSARLDFIQNPFRMHKKILYDDRNKSIVELLETIDASLKDTCVKVIVRAKVNSFWFNLFINKIEELGVVNIQTVDDHLNLDMTETEAVANTDDTLSFIRNSVLTSNIQEDDKQKLDKVLIELYNEALTLGE